MVPLSELGAFLQENRYLPRLKKDLYTGQYKVGSMDTALLEKIEELSIYIVELNEQNLRLSYGLISQNQTLTRQQQQLQQLNASIQALEAQ